MSTRFWQIVSAAAWMGVLLVAALVLALQSRTPHEVRPAWKPAASELDAPSASPRMTVGDDRARLWEIGYERRSLRGLHARDLRVAR